jgi:hypothetical protein
MSNPPKDLTAVLWNDTPKNNGYPSPEQYRNHILDQYKLYVEMADKISARRDVANGFFLTLNGIFLGASGALIDRGYSFEPKWALLFPLGVLWLICFFWWRLIISYKKLNGAKFQIVGQLEARLPCNPYGKTEWEFLLKQGTDRKTYWPLTHLESKIPGIFAFGYLIAAICLWFSK